MKKTSILLALASGLALCVLLARADQLDDLIADMKKGVTAAPDKQAEILKATGTAASKSYRDSIVNLYLWEVKASIVDPENNGGWPYRSFLVEGDPSVRKSLTKALKDRFEEKPYSLLVYAAICPAIYTGDDKLVDRLQLYLKGHDSFLYKLEQTQIDQYWRPYIKDALVKEAAGTKTEK
jgi:hypothetical protein